MPTIDQLNAASELDPSDDFPVFKYGAGATRRVSAQQIVDMAIDQLALTPAADQSEAIAAIRSLIVSVKDHGAKGDGVTDDQAALVAAVDAASLSGAVLEWPPGTYVSTASIPGFHAVRHSGAGIVNRGGNLFAVTTPAGSTQQNRLHVATNGSATNDGLSSAQPFASFQNAFDAIANYRLDGGRWEVIGAAGTYDFKSGQQTLSTPSKNRVVVRGPVVGASPAVPTLVIDGGGAAGAIYRHGLSASGLGVNVEFRDIKAVNFSMGAGDTTRIGFVGENEANLLTNNLHVTGASWCGIYAFNTVRSRNYGGILDGCRIGICPNATEMTAGSESAPILVRNSTESGAYWSRGSQGHLDYCVFEDNAVGFLVAENSRCDTVANIFKRNTKAIVAQTGGVYGEGGAPNIFNGGTADANGTDKEYKTSSGDTSEMRVAEQYSRFGYDRTTRNHTGTTVSTVLSTPYTVKAYRLAGAGKSLRVHVFGIFTQASAGSIMTVNFGGMALAITVPAAAANLVFELEATLLEVQGGYRSFGVLRQGLNQFRYASVAAGFDRTIDNAISIAATLANAADSLAVYRSEVHMMG